MKRHFARHAIFLASCLAASAAFAGSDIVKCVDAAGHVTLTDEPCRNGSETMPVAASAHTPPAADAPRAAALPAAALPAADAPPAADGEHGAAAAAVSATAMLPAGPGTTRIVTSERILAQARTALTRHDNFSGQPATGRRALAGDVATLKAARASLQLMDSGRQSRLAGLN